MRIRLVALVIILIGLIALRQFNKMRKAQANTSTQSVNTEESETSSDDDSSALSKAVGAHKISKASQVRDLCAALDKLLESKDSLGKGKGFDSPSCKLATQFQDVDSDEAVRVVREEGLPRLEKLYDALYQNKSDKDALMMIMKVFAIYDSNSGTDRIIQAAKDGFEKDGFMWEPILSALDKHHRCAQKVFTALSSNLDDNFLSVALLDASNSYFIDGGAGKHPFDNDKGPKLLEAWLSAKKDDDGRAHSSTAAIPFISEPARTKLLNLAASHASSDVRYEAGWAMAKLGNPQGIKILQTACMDVNASKNAIEYLKELKREDAIPSGARAPDFSAQAEMSQWLQYPSEFGRPPDQISVFDTRKLYWPPTDDVRQVWLIKYTYKPKKADEKEDSGLGMVGSTTFALFGEATTDLTPENAYALYCAWELDGQSDPRLKGPRSVKAGLEVLKRYNSSFGK